jgi:hypothetical protein
MKRSALVVTLGLLGLLSCSSGEGSGARSGAPADASSAPDAAGPDVVFTMDGHVDAGSEAFGCLYVRMPTDRGTIAVPSAESHYTPGSHHFLVYRTSYTDMPDGGATAHPCTDAEQIEDITGTYYEAQTPSARRDLPPGVAHLFKPGEILLLTAHYLDSGAAGYDTHVTFQLHTVDPSTIAHEAGSVFFYNWDISIPPMSQVTVTRTCPIPKDVNLALLWSHMHSRGIAFKATTDDAVAAQQAGDLYDSNTWNEPTPRAFGESPPVVVHGGSTITYSCTYRNTTDSTFVQGPSAATNEMCILHGMYWPRLDTTTELCLDGTGSTGPVLPLDATVTADGGALGDGGVGVSDAGDAIDSAPGD